VTAREEERDRKEKAQETADFEHPRRPHHFLDALLETLLGPQ
jgi:hypothetical protein